MDISDDIDVRLENVYYPGLFNESVRQCKLNGKQYMYFIASDVYVSTPTKMRDIACSLGEEDVAIWAPSTKGQAHGHCRNKRTGGMRDAPYAEGFVFLVDVELCDIVYPVDRKHNTLGYGIDLLLGFNCIKNRRKRCVIDDRVEVYHREGKRYDPDVALDEMYAWAVAERFGPAVEEYFSYYRQIAGDRNPERLLAYLTA